MKIVHHILSSKKKREATTRKLSVLEVIDEEKCILFAPFSTSITHADKVRGWQAVLHRAQTVGLVGQDRDWRFIRDKVFSVWKSRTMAKRENAIATSSAGSSIKFDKVDLKILDIIGQGSPVSDGIVEDAAPETGSQTQELIDKVPHIADIQNIPQTSNAGSIGSTSNIRTNGNPKRKLKAETDVYVLQKKKLTLELLNHDIYLRKLQALKLEKELGLNRSEYTLELEVLKEIKTENTCEMEFEGMTDRLF